MEEPLKQILIAITFGDDAVSEFTQFGLRHVELLAAVFDAWSFNTMVADRVMWAGYEDLHIAKGSGY